MKKVKAITIRNGEPVFNLASTSANDDWIRSARKLSAGDTAGVEADDKIPMYFREEVPKKENKRKRKKK